MVATTGGKRITQMSDFFRFYGFPIRLRTKGLTSSLAEDGHLARAFIESVNGVIGSYESAVR